MSASSGVGADGRLPADGLADALAAERAARLAAERINARRDEFLGMVSHELRTPLNAMVGWLHVLEASQADPGGPIARRAVAGLERAVEQQRALVDTLLETARALRGDLVLARERIDLAVIADEAARARREATPALQIDVEVDRAGCTVEADPKRLRHVLDELLAHAAKFADLGRLTMSVASWGDASIAVVLRFDADAAGIAWEPFRDDPSGATAPARRRGGGIGLVLCQRLIELSGGAVLVDAEPVGLSVVLPCVDVAQAAADDASARSEPARSVFDGLDVLVVDDQPDMREVLSTILTHAGARVHGAASAAHALVRYVELAADGRLDVGVLDIAMPIEDGIVLVQRIREAERSNGWRRVPMVALTAHASKALRGQALAAGFDAFLSKPLAPAQLQSTVEQLLGRGDAPAASG